MSDRTTWWEAEPKRFARDRKEVTARFPDLSWIPEGAGGWEGRLSRWPFDRPEPRHLIDLVGETGMPVWVVYGHAYPMVPPLVYPLDPVPAVAEWTVHRWHVMGDGSLCLLQQAAMWDPRASVLDLLVKAAGWRIEYALMKAGSIDSMSLGGIVSDPSSDDLIARTARGLAVPKAIGENE